MGNELGLSTSKAGSILAQLATAKKFLEQSTSMEDARRIVANALTFVEEDIGDLKVSREFRLDSWGQNEELFMASEQPRTLIRIADRLTERIKTAVAVEHVQETGVALDELLRMGRSGERYVRLVGQTIDTFEAEFCRLTGKNSVPILQMLREHVRAMAEALDDPRRFASSPPSNLKEIVRLAREDIPVVEKSLKRVFAESFAEQLGKSAASGGAFLAGAAMALAMPSIVGYVIQVAGADAGATVHEWLTRYLELAKAGDD